MVHSRWWLKLEHTNIFKERLEMGEEIPIQLVNRRLQELTESKKILSKEVRYAKGVGPKLGLAFAKRGIYTVKDLLFTLPRRYENRKDIKKIAELEPDERAIVVGVIEDAGVITTFGGREIYRIIINDGTGYLNCVWFRFNDRFLGKFKPGAEVVVFGKVKLFRGKFEMHHPTIDFAPEIGRLKLGEIVPIYFSADGISGGTIRRAVSKVVMEHARFVESPVPESLERRLEMPPLKEAILRVHFPDDENMERYTRRIIFEELFILQAGLLLKKKEIKDISATFVPHENPLLEDFLKTLPFELTGAQKRVLTEIKEDLKSGKTMYRLIQGDVGSGKTVVAFCAALLAVAGGYQVAFMAPTEVLAEQHFGTMTEWARPLGVKVVLLTGSVRGSQRDSTLSAIELGRAQIIVGTHALIVEGVKFKNLGLCVVDEQHRFGVLQRLALRCKGENEYKSPHFLVMTATPIPRTLAITLWGDLDISVIDEFPPGKLPVKTYVTPDWQREAVYREIGREIEEGGQVFVVYPLLKESEKLDFPAATQMYEVLKRRFPNVGLIHGRLSGQEKERVIKSFRACELKVLVSTTVIEVGVDIPSATMMVVEHAERFGLSQLHQLRGRVGRGGIQGKCYLVAGENAGEEAERRLRILERTSDGFKIAEEDMRIRGVGEIMGTRQHGLSELKVADLIKDSKLLYLAREEARKVIFEKNYVPEWERDVLIRYVKEHLGWRIDTAASG